MDIHYTENKNIIWIITLFHHVRLFIFPIRLHMKKNYINTYYKALHKNDFTALQNLNII